MSLSPTEIRKVVSQALQEDAARYDITTRRLIPKNLRVQAVLIAKEDFIVCGLPVAKEVFLALDRRVRMKFFVEEGKRVQRGKKIAQLQGPAQAILSGERVALNFLQHLSGIATKTQGFVREVRGTKAKILDTRKTLPGLRFLERYAVRTGGGKNHRYDLKEAVMIKDNHWVLLPDDKLLKKNLRRIPSKIPVIAEVSHIKDLKGVLALKLKHILLDNMNTRQLREAVRIVRGKAKLEASGGMSLKRVRAVAKTGVDYISVGSLTHSAPAVDISLEILKGPRP